MNLVDKMVGRKRRFRLMALAIVIVILCIALPSLKATMAGESHAPKENAENQQGRASDATAIEVILSLERYYIDKVDTGKLVKAYLKNHSIPEMLATLGDPYTRYMNPREFLTLLEDAKGEFDGIGITVGLRDNMLTVIAPLEGTPGYKAGLKPGDHIVTIDGKSTKDMALDYAVSLMRGKKGTQVILGVERKGEKGTLTFKIIRDTVKAPPPVEAKMLDNKIGYVILANFEGKDTAAEMRSAIEKLEKEGMQGLILDLRFNGGGLLELAVQIAQMFIPEGKPIVHTIDRDGLKQTAYAGPGKRFSLPMVVLVNEYSASASEILSGALQDLKVADLVGTKTFGKGVVQIIQPLSDGSGLTITVQRYLTPLGRSIHGTGLKPDIYVELPVPDKSSGSGGSSTPKQIKDTQLEKAKQVLLKKIQEEREKQPHLKKIEAGHKGVTKSRPAA
ncbi:MAG TPA: S41 family peptidase [Firmicutes bacterium]|nr:S41 family peptidase [Bacillota bacterium]